MVNCKCYYVCAEMGVLSLLFFTLVVLVERCVGRVRMNCQCVVFGKP